ncbi:hypothetical protein RI054_04g21910 [Pseudoscourfieldia marina]
MPLTTRSAENRIVTRSLIVDPHTGEPGVELVLCRYLCHCAGQLEAKGSRGTPCLESTSGDCFYAAKRYHFLIDGLPRIYAHRPGIVRQLEEAALLLNKEGSYCYPRATIGPVVNANVSVSDHNVVVILHDDTRLEEAVVLLISRFRNVVDEYHYDGEYQVDIELIEDVTWGVDKARVMWRKEAPAVEAPMSRV